MKTVTTTYTCDRCGKVCDYEPLAIYIKRDDWFTWGNYRASASGRNLGYLRRIFMAIHACVGGYSKPKMQKTYSLWSEKGPLTKVCRECAKEFDEVISAWINGKNRIVKTDLHNQPLEDYDNMPTLRIASDG